jgi:hypothetical protein
VKDLGKYSGERKVFWLVPESVMKWAKEMVRLKEVALAEWLGKLLEEMLEIGRDPPRGMWKVELKGKMTEIR